MTDIVERARMTANCGIPDFTNSKLLDELADKIERLRAMQQGYREEASELRIENERLREDAKLWEKRATMALEALARMRHET